MSLQVKKFQGFNAACQFSKSSCLWFFFCQSFFLCNHFSPPTLSGLCANLDLSTKTYLCTMCAKTPKVWAKGLRHLLAWKCLLRPHLRLIKSAWNHFFDNVDLGRGSLSSTTIIEQCHRYLNSLYLPAHQIITCEEQVYATSKGSLTLQTSNWF